MAASIAGRLQQQRYRQLLQRRCAARIATDITGNTDNCFAIAAIGNYWIAALCSCANLLIIAAMRCAARRCAASHQAPPQPYQHQHQRDTSRRCQQPPPPPICRAFIDAHRRIPQLHQHTARPTAPSPLPHIATGNSSTSTATPGTTTPHTDNRSFHVTAPAHHYYRLTPLHTAPVAPTTRQPPTAADRPLTTVTVIRLAPAAIQHSHRPPPPILRHSPPSNRPTP